MNATARNVTFSDSFKVAAARKARYLCYGSPAFYFNRFFGPAWAQARADILSELRGVRVPKSKAAWGVFQADLFAAFGPSEWTCLADRESKTETAISIQATALYP